MWRLLYRTCFTRCASVCLYSRLCFACHTDAIDIYLNFEQEVHFPKSYFITPLGCVCLLNLSAPDCVCVRVSKSVVLFVFFKLNVVLNVVNRESCLTHFLSAKWESKKFFGKKLLSKVVINFKGGNNYFL